MTRTLLVEVVSPEANLFKGEATLVVATTTAGEVGILPLHAPIVAELAVGELRLKMGNNPEDTEVFSVYGGYLQCAEDHMVVIADLAINAKSADITALEDDLESAKARINDVPKDAIDELAALEREVRWVTNCIKVAKRHQKG